MRKRVLALVCCLSLTLGLFTYHPPEAKAIVTEASLATSVLWSFMQSAGITFNGTGMNSSSWAEAIEPYLRDFTEWKDSAAKSFWHWLGYDGASEFIKALSWSKITHPTTMPFPSVVIPPAAAKKMGEFTHWFAEKVGLVSGGESKPVYDGATHLTSVDGYSVLADKSFSDYYNYNFGRNKLSIVKKTSSGSLAYASLKFYTPTFVAPDTGKYKISFVGSTSENSLSSNSQYGLGFWKVGVYKTDSADSNAFGYGGSLCDNETYIGGFYGARPGPCSGSCELNFIKGEKYKFQIRVGAQDDFSSAIFFWDFSLAKSDGVSSSGFATQAGALSPTYDDKGEKPTVVAYPNINGDLSSINDLLQQILDKLAANDLNSSASLEGEAAPDVPATDIGWKGTIEKIYQGIIDLPGRIADAFKALLEGLFAPDAALMQEMTDTFKGKFSFLTTLHKVGTDLFGMTAETDPPVIWVHLEDAEGKYTYGGPVKALDLSWYQRYKADVDKLISGFLWLAFLWLLFKRAASIIHGGEMYTEYASDIRDYYRSGKKDDGPTVPVNRRLGE